MYVCELLLLAKIPNAVLVQVGETKIKLAFIKRFPIYVPTLYIWCNTIKKLKDLNLKYLPKHRFHTLSPSCTI